MRKGWNTPEFWLFFFFFPPVLGFTMLQLLRSLYAVAELHSCSHFKKFYKKNKILNFEKNPSFR